jgi:hypothetical protein
VEVGVGTDRSILCRVSNIEFHSHDDRRASTEGWIDRLVEIEVHQIERRKVEEMRQSRDMKGGKFQV